MRGLFILFCSLLFSLSYGQNKNYIFLVETSNYSDVPKFQKNSGNIMYVGTDAKEKDFFSKHILIDMSQTFPDSRRQRTLNVFTFITSDVSFAVDLLKAFPQKYLGFEDVSDFIPELSNSYPNDYGTTTPSPTVNLGVPQSLKNFDYIGVPKAWDYTFGNSEVLIGISDSNIDTSDVDFKYKTVLLSGYNDFAYNPSYTMSNDSWHGTATASFAAAQGNNAHGMTGICSECGILGTKFSYGTPGTAINPTPNLNNLLQLAINGAKIINMSWGSPSQSVDPNYNYYQWIFDELHDDYNVVLVAASHNNNSFQPQYAQYNYMLYSYPASFNHVISVLSVNHKNKWGEQLEYVDGWGYVSRFVEDLITPTAIENYQGNGPMGFYSAHTTNDRVDICAPGYEVFQYPWYVLNNDIFYGSGTSGSAPHVSGTAGLMLSLNECLINDEVEDVLQLTSKNLEHIPGNEPFIGRSGSGKMETGDAVEFVYEMMQNNGNATIDGQDFYRFDFDLKHINNKLTISNQIFRDISTADFTARTVIEILPGSDFKPTTGFVDLKIDSAIDVSCTPPVGTRMANQGKKDNEPAIIALSKLYPNPNNGTFEIALNSEIKTTVSIEVYDIYGKVVYKNTSANALFTVDIPNLSSGMYIVKLSGDNYNETLKFVKK